ncbi:hypothetical protein, partial [Francisella hispaniensis]|uniref:hypothetical protein n=1 Tax=Francisella hispaniensis TaxID=622488 RepID=UPI0019059C85
GRGIDVSKYDWTGVETYLESAGWTDVVVSNEQLTATAPAYVEVGSNTYEIAPGLLKAVDKGGVHVSNSKAVSGKITQDTGLKTDIVITAPDMIKEHEQIYLVAVPAPGGRDIDKDNGYTLSKAVRFLRNNGWQYVYAFENTISATAPDYIADGSNTYTLPAGIVTAVDKGGVDATNNEAINLTVSQDPSIKTDIVITAPTQVTELQSATFTAAASGGRGIDVSKYDWTGVETYLESAGWTDVVVSNEQ